MANRQDIYKIRTSHGLDFLSKRFTLAVAAVLRLVPGAAGRLSDDDLHAYILPGLDDGPRTWKEALKMACLAVADGIYTLAATAHLYPRKAVEPGLINNKERILAHWNEFQEKLAAADIALKVIPGCDRPLSFESLQLLEEGQVLTLNDGHRYLVLELPNVSFPPAIEEIFFGLQTISFLQLGGHFLRYQLPLQKGDNMEDIPKKIIRGEPWRWGGTGAGGG